MLLKKLQFLTKRSNGLSKYNRIFIWIFFRICWIAEQFNPKQSNTTWFCTWSRWGGIVGYYYVLNHLAIYFFLFLLEKIFPRTGILLFAILSSFFKCSIFFVTLRAKKSLTTTNIYSRFHNIYCSCPCYLCSLGYCINADCNVAANILRKAFPDIWDKVSYFRFLAMPETIRFHHLYKRTRRCCMLSAWPYFCAIRTRLTQTGWKDPDQSIPEVSSANG